MLIKNEDSEKLMGDLKSYNHYVDKALNRQKIKVREKLAFALKTIFRIREAAVLVVVIIIGLILTLSSPYFLTIENLKAIAIGLSTDAIMAVGMTILLVSGGFDLSIGSVLAFGGAISALFLGKNFNMWISIIIALAVAAIIGLINGTIVTKIGVNPLITTLGMMSIARGATLVVAQGYPLAEIPLEFTVFGQGEIFGLPVPMLIMLLIVIIGEVMLRRSRFLRQAYYIGSNERAARLSGIHVDKVKMFSYVITATLAVIAGLISTSRLAAAFPQAGIGAELRVISACVIGGASLAGGEGSVLGSLLGVVLLAIVNNGLILKNVSIYWQGIVSGLILILAVTLDILSRRRRVR